MERNKSLKWCPYPGCGRAVRFPQAEITNSSAELEQSADNFNAGPNISYAASNNVYPGPNNLYAGPSNSHAGPSNSHAVLGNSHTGPSNSHTGSSTLYGSLTAGSSRTSTYASIGEVGLYASSSSSGGRMRGGRTPVGGSRTPAGGGSSSSLLMCSASLTSPDSAHTENPIYSRPKFALHGALPITHNPDSSYDDNKDATKIMTNKDDHVISPSQKEDCMMSPTRKEHHMLSPTRKDHHMTSSSQKEDSVMSPTRKSLMSPTRVRAEGYSDSGHKNSRTVNGVTCTCDKTADYVYPCLVNNIRCRKPSASTSKSQPGRSNNPYYISGSSGSGNINVFESGSNNNNNGCSRGANDNLPGPSPHRSHTSNGVRTSHYQPPPVPPERRQLQPTPPSHSVDCGNGHFFCW